MGRQNSPNRENKYLGTNLLEVDFAKLTRMDIGLKVKKINSMYENRNQLDHIYRLTQSTYLNGEEEWGKIHQKLGEVYQFLTDDWVKEFDARHNPWDEVSEVFEALVYQVLTKHEEVEEIAYEPELYVRGKLITPDFVINKNRIVEAKLSKNSQFKNVSKYREMDSKLIKVFLSKKKQTFNFKKGGTFSIRSIIDSIEKESKVELTEEREILEMLMAAMGYLIRIEDGRGDSDLNRENRHKIMFKIDVLKAQVQAILRGVSKIK